MTTKRKTRRVSHRQALVLFDAVSVVAAASGYACGLYGSTVHGGGNDVDLILAPFPHTAANRWEERLLAGLGHLGEVRVLPYSPGDGFLPVEVVTLEGYSLDLHVFR